MRQARRRDFVLAFQFQFCRRRLQFNFISFAFQPGCISFRYLPTIITWLYRQFNQAPSAIYRVQQQFARRRSFYSTTIIHFHRFSSISFCHFPPSSICFPVPQLLTFRQLPAPRHRRIFHASLSSRSTSFASANARDNNCTPRSSPVCHRLSSSSPVDCRF